MLRYAIDKTKYVLLLNKTLKGFKYCKNGLTPALLNFKSKCKGFSFVWLFGEVDAKKGNWNDKCRKIYYGV